MECRRAQQLIVLWTICHGLTMAYQPLFRGMYSTLPVSPSDVDFYPLPQDLASRPIVKISDGSLRGSILRTVDGRAIASFQSIPYAQPPVGSLRFRDPVQNMPWNGIRDAMPRSPECIQWDMMTPGHIVHGLEDCLYINVYTPHSITSKKNSSLPVMVFIHGGAYFLGSGSKYGPRYLLDHNIILVTFNYRLGPLGFLSTGDDTCPGNQGMKDQVLALKWVQKNIKRFGGDPNSVTIFGHSAGATSVGLHLISPLSRGLFHRAISQSGSTLSFWTNLPNGPETAKRIGKARQCPVNSSQELLACLRKLPAESLASLQMELAEWAAFPFIKFAPTVEHDHPGAFMSKSPYEYYENGQAANVPWITGLTTNEQSFFVAVFMKTVALVKEANDNWTKVGGPMLGMDAKNINSKKLKKIWKFYMGNKTFKWSTRHEFSRLLSDRYFVVSALASMRYHSMYTNQTVYGYLLSYQGRYSHTQQHGDEPKDWGVVHNDCLMYLLNSPDAYPSFNRDDPELKMSRKMTSMWTNFAIHGKPYLTAGKVTKEVWNPIQRATDLNSPISLLNLDSKLKMIENPYVDGYKFWMNEIYNDTPRSYGYR